MITTILLVVIIAVQLGVILWMGHTGFEELIKHLNEREQLRDEIDSLKAQLHLAKKGQSDE